MSHCCGCDRAEKMLATALDMERKGLEFYEKTLQTCHNEVGRRIFAMLKKDEEVHARRIQMHYDTLRGTHQWAADWKTHAVDHPDLLEMMKSLAVSQGTNLKAEASDLEALDVGIDFEHRAVVFYMENLNRATDPVERAFVKRMVEEEEAHWKALSEMKYFLTDPAAWFRENEKTTLDGGGAGV